MKNTERFNSKIEFITLVVLVVISITLFITNVKTYKSLKIYSERVLNVEMVKMEEEIRNIRGEVSMLGYNSSDKELRDASVLTSQMYSKVSDLRYEIGKLPNLNDKKALQRASNYLIAEISNSRDIVKIQKDRKDIKEMIEILRERARNKNIEDIDELVKFTQESIFSLGEWRYDLHYQLWEVKEFIEYIRTGRISV